MNWPRLSCPFSVGRVVGSSNASQVGRPWSADHSMQLRTPPPNAPDSSKSALRNVPNVEQMRFFTPYCHQGIGYEKI